MAIQITGIYKITNISNNKFYIGSSSCSIQMRWRRHKSDLNRNIHSNKHLQASWNKYGEDLFKFEIIEICQPQRCIEREQYYMDTLKPQYNKTIKADSCLGKKATEETKLKMSKARKGKSVNIGNTNRRGSKHTIESRRLMSLSRIGLKNHVKPIEDDLGNKYPSITEASKITGIKRTTINEAIKQNRKTRSGRIFKYILEDK